jgi:hypothetical protein
MHVAGLPPFRYFEIVSIAASSQGTTASYFTMPTSRALQEQLSKV